MDVLLFLLVGLVSVTCIPLHSQIVNTCGVNFCRADSTCRNVLNISSGAISAVCLNYYLHSPTGNEEACSTGQPLWVVSPRGSYYEAGCGRVVNRINCPPSYRCVTATNDVYSLCCPSTQYVPGMDLGGLPGGPGILGPGIIGPGILGQCPPPSRDYDGICTDRCRSDNDCGPYLKCCRNYCGALTCQSPASSGPLTCLRHMCSADTVCTDTPTGPLCVSPKRDLKCPHATRIDFRCFHRDDCITDAACYHGQGQVCCPTLCGRRCLIPQ